VCLIGDDTDLEGHCFLKAFTREADAEKMTVRVLEHATVAGVYVIGRRIDIHYVAAVTVYANIVTMLNAHPLLSLHFQAYLPAGGAGATLVTAQEDPLSFTAPALTAVVQDAGGLFTFQASHTPARLRYVALDCGVGSTVTVSASDAGGAYTRVISAGLDGNNQSHNLDYPLLANDLVSVAETVSGTPAPGVNKRVTLYVVKDRVF